MRVVVDVDDHRGISSGLGFCRRRGGNSKYKAHGCITKHDMMIRGARGVLTQCYVIPTKGDNIRECYPEVCNFLDRRNGGERFQVRYARDA